MLHERRAPLTGLAIVAFIALTACAAEEAPTGLPPANPGGGGSGAGTPTGTSTGQGGMGDGGGGGMGGAEPEPITCQGDFAFRADGMSFAGPTPAALADALAEHIGPDDHPITVVLRNAGDAPSVGASFAMETGPKWTFFPPLNPTFTEAVVTGSKFHTMAPAPEAYLRIRHHEGVLDLALEDVDVDAETELDCAFAEVTLEATIPASMRDETIVIDDGEPTIGELAGGYETEDIPFVVTFSATSVSFDFDTLD